MGKRIAWIAALWLAAGAVAAAAPAGHDDRGWEQPQRPFRLYGNTYYVGSKGLSAILIASPAGLVLIDGTLPANAAMIEGNIRALGFRLRDLKLILNSHAHGDHAGAIAAIAHDSGAQVAASSGAAKALEQGGNDPDDPQHGLAPDYPRVAEVRRVADGETLRLGPLAIQAHYTPGHTPGSTTWTWTSCEGERCLAMVYADSLALLGAPGYRYGDPAHPERLAAFRQALRMLAALPCDILMTPHPEASDLLGRAARRRPGHDGDAPLVDRAACKAYAAEGRRGMDLRIAEESGSSAR